MKFKKGDKVRFMHGITLPDGGIIAKDTVWNIQDLKNVTYAMANGDFCMFIPFEEVDSNCKYEGQATDSHNILYDVPKKESKGKFNPDYYKYRNGDDVFAIADWFGLSFPLGNSLKYILRAGRKEGEKKSDDLNKAIKCIQREIELEAAKRGQ